jgi:hypothetical protein
MKIISLGQCCAISDKLPLRCAEPATTERGGRVVCRAHSRRLKPSEVWTPPSAEWMAFRAGREDAKAKQLKTDVYWRRFDERRREKMSWYERVIIKNEITRTALAKEAGTSKDIVGEAILEIDRIIRCSQGMPWRRPKTVSADDFEMIRAGYYNRLARFF